MMTETSPFVTEARATAVQGNEAVAVHLVELADLLGGNDRLRVVDDEDDAKFLRDVEDEVTFEVVEGLRGSFERKSSGGTRGTGRSSS
jgi:hypothetical protein